eukprot:TRINITY_DN14786_c0_g2_i1.p1 TRINITY_DN14786_c0_g2~~TRINITY_DN14786_c0_g2_i1.p1  ORF type:complete len:556 (+),score=192.25 TRINITY_DN14786_c0_g2_i1:25-1668(+)
MSDYKNEYERLDNIGWGGYGQVFRGRSVNDPSKIVAIKVLNFDNDDVEELMKECRFMRECNHPNTVNIIASIIVGSKLWIVMDYMAGRSVADAVKYLGSLEKPVRLTELHISIILREVLKALKYLHSQAKTHRDVKAANILLSAQCDVKVADFGVSGQLNTIQVTNNGTGRMHGMQSYVGTPHFMAPEVIAQSNYDQKCDIWSLGITTFELATGAVPYDRNPMKAVQEIPLLSPPQLKGEFTVQFKQFVSYCLVKKPEHRPTADDVYAHPFITVSGETPTTYLQTVFEPWFSKIGVFDDDDDDINLDDSNTEGNEHDEQSPNPRIVHDPAPSYDTADENNVRSEWDFPDTMSSLSASGRHGRIPSLGGGFPLYNKPSVPRLPLNGVAATGRITPKLTPRVTPRITPRERGTTPLSTPRGGQVSLSTAAYQSVVKPALVKLSRSNKGASDQIVRLTRLIDEAQAICPSFSLLLVQHTVRLLSQSPTHSHLLHHTANHNITSPTTPVQTGQVKFPATTPQGSTESLAMTGPAAYLLESWIRKHRTDDTT